MAGEETGQYAHLPEDLVKKILEAVPATVEKMNRMFDVQEAPIQESIQRLRDSGLVHKLKPEETTDSLMAADGGNIIEKMSGTDVLLAVAVGVEGLTMHKAGGWPEGSNQYYQWQTVMPHHEATPRLCQGVMFLMELNVLAISQHEIRIMDGTHLTPILKINSMLSAKDEKAGREYVDGLQAFLAETYEKVIPDMPDMVSEALNSDKVISIAKYSSSRDILDSRVKRDDITLDDKTFFTLGLQEDEYVGPLPVGQSQREKGLWSDLHITANLSEIADLDELNGHFETAIAPIKGKDADGDGESNVWFTYYKPHEQGPAVRIECKKALAHDEKRFFKMLGAIKYQTVFPDIREPFPQFVADLMAKSVSGGLYALQDAIRL